MVGSFTHKGLEEIYLTGKINQAYNLAVLTLSETCSPYITKVATIPSLPIGTTDLSAYQNVPDGPLYGLIDVFQNGVDWKMAGKPDNWYARVIEKDKLPDVVINQGPPASYPSSVMYFEFRSYILFVTPAGILVDLRVRGEFRPTPLVKDTDSCAIHPLMDSVLAELTAAICYRERGNPTQQQAHETIGMAGLDNIANQLVRSQQGNVVRLGRANGRRR